MKVETKKAWLDNWPYFLLSLLVLVALSLGASNLFRNSGADVNLNGKNLNLSTSLKFESKVMTLKELLVGDKNLVVFWATWCAPCVDELRLMPSMLPKIKEKGYSPLFVNYDSEDNVASALAFASQNNVQSAVDSKGDILFELGVSSLPISLVVDKSGKILQTIAGELSLEDL